MNSFFVNSVQSRWQSIILSISRYLPNSGLLVSYNRVNVVWTGRDLPEALLNSIDKPLIPFPDDSLVYAPVADSKDIIVLMLPWALRCESRLEMDNVLPSTLSRDNILDLELGSFGSLNRFTGWHGQS